jgi:sirohydrochlorin cobaltochelatase
MVIVLVMHGAPPKDFPRQELREFFGLHARMEQVKGPEQGALAQRHTQLEAKMRAWPRTAQNDPFWAASYQMAKDLAQATGHEVLVGFNEFCAPTLEDALEKAVETEVEPIVVVTPMMTRGGEHAEVEIPETVHQAQVRHPEVSFKYAWPFETTQVAQFLADQIDRALNDQ